MKVPKEVNESASELKKSTGPKGNANSETKTLDENVEHSDNDPPTRVLESNTSALIPPWIKNSFGITDKSKGGTKPNQKGIRPGYNERNFHDSADLKTEPDDDCLSASYYIQESIASNPIFEVNIGNEADFPENSPRPCGKLKSVWKSKPGKTHQYEYSIFSPYKDKRNSKSLKSEVASVDVVLPLDETYSSEEDRKKAKQQAKGKTKASKKGSVGGEQKSEGDAEPHAKGGEVTATSNGIKSPDSKLLVACGKSKMDALTEEDMSLLKEVKNQIGHKEGFDKLFQSIKENGIPETKDASPVRNGKDKKEDKEAAAAAADKARREIPRQTRADAESDNMMHSREGSFGTESETKSGRGKAMDEEKKYFEDTVKHHEKKKWNQQRFVKLREEPRLQKPPEYDADAEKEKKGFDRNRTLSQRTKENRTGEGNRDKKTRQRHISNIEKAVSDTLHKFIELYRFQIPPDVVSGMKKSIVQTLQNEYQESNNPKKNIENIDVLCAVQDLFRSKEMKKGDVHSFAIDEKDDKSKNECLVPAFKSQQDVSAFDGDEELLNDDEAVKASIRNLLQEHKFPKENDVVENEHMKDLKKEFEKGLEFMHSQLDITGTTLCSVILEKVEVGDASKKVRIIHNFSTGTTESVKVYDEKVNIGSPEGDNFNTPTKMCDCQRDSLGMDSFRLKMKNQWCQTGDFATRRQSTQTDRLNVTFKDVKLANVNPGLYRMTKAAELGRFYLYPEEQPDKERPNAAAEVYELFDADFIEKYARFKESVLRSTSKETSVSEKGSYLKDKHCGRLRRKIKSDCVGLNNAKLENGLERGHSKNSLADLLVGRMLNGSIVRSLEEETNKREGEEEAEEEEEEEGGNDREENPGDEGKSSKRAAKPENEDESRGTMTASETGYHCVWLWNGKKMDPGVDLKVHVENLLREKLKEMLNEVRVEETAKNEDAGTETSSEHRANKEAPDESAPRDDGDAEEEADDDKKLAVKKTNAKICITGEPDSPEGPFAPFIFSGAARDDQAEPETEAVEKSEEVPKWECFGKSVREVGTQNSRHAMPPPNSSRGKMCAAGKLAKQRCKKEFLLQKARCERSRSSNAAAKPSAYALDVGAAKKVKLELNASKEEGETAHDGGESSGKSVRQCYSAVSNGSSVESSGDGQLRVKLIGIEVSKEAEDDPEECETSESFNNLQVKKFIVKDVPSRDKVESAGSDETNAGLKNKQWELIENVLNRVNQKEKEGLWNDVRDYVKRKIGRDINDEGAREVCIEIEQDVPKFNKGKSDHAVVAKGNYTRNEGDVEVEVDLTLDDLERILRHRQKKLRRRQYYENQKIKVESRKSSSSSATSDVAAGDAFKYQAYAKHCGGFGDHYARNAKTVPEEN